MSQDKEVRLKIRALDKMSRVIDGVSSKFPKLSQRVKETSKEFALFNKKTKTFTDGLKKAGRGFQKVGGAITLGVTLPLTAMAAQGVKSFGDFEQGLRGIEKTTGLSRSAVADIGKKFDELSTVLPVTTEELLELAQAGGQLGIKTSEDLEKFTTTMAKLSRASDVAGEDGAKAIARILTVTGEGIGKIDSFSSALVDLGNNAAASEKEILEVATRVGGAISRFDAGSANILGISTALRSLGKDAEASGSTIGRAFDGIDQAIKSGVGSGAMNALSRLTEIPEKDLKNAFAKDSTAVFQKFIEGLARVQSSGGNLIKVMKIFDLEGTRVNDIIGTLAKNPKILAENIDRASEAFSSNTALEKEVAVQTDSFNSSLTLLSNTFNSLTRMIGEDLAPVVSWFADILKGIMNFLRNNPSFRTLVVVLGAMVAVMGPILVAFGTFLTMLPLLVSGAAALGIALLPLTIKFILIGAAIAAIITLFVIIVRKWDDIKKAFETNPFLKFVKWVAILINPIARVLFLFNRIKGAMDNFKTVGGFFKDLFMGVDENKTGASLGPAVGAGGKTKGIGPAAQGATNTNNARVDVNINDPGGNAKVRGKADNMNLFTLNPGFSGGFN